jgi:hypothetical protein
MKIPRSEARLEQLFWRACETLDAIMTNPVTPGAEHRLHAAEVVLEAIAGGPVLDLSEDVVDPATPHPTPHPH